MSYDNNTALEHALFYALRGWPVFPVQVWWHEGERKWKKSPLIKDWPNAASCDPDQVREWFSRSDLELSIGGITGPATFYVVDVDYRNGGTASDLPNTLRSNTRSKGNHYFFKHSTKIGNGGPIRDGVDFRGVGGFVVLPGSLGYEWATDPQEHMAELPAWIATRATHSAKDGAGAPFLEVEDIDAYAASVLAVVVQEIEDAPEGTRNATLNAGSFRLGRFIGGKYLDEREVVGALEDAAETAGLGHGETMSTVDSGIAAGKKIPITLVLPGENLDVFDEVDELDADHEFDVAGFAEEQPDKRDRAVERQAERLRVDEAARALVAAEKLAALPVPVATSLTSLSAAEWPQQRYLIDRLWPANGNAFLAAQAKVGKTTLVTNLVKSLVDNQPFLGEFEVAQLSGRVGILNFEMSDRQMTEWLLRTEIENTDAVQLWNLRGLAGLFDIRNEARRAEWAKQIKDADVQVLMLDCATPVLVALQLNEDKELRVLLNKFGSLLVESGATEGLVVHHAGWDATRSRGDSAAVGWGESNWLYTKEGEDTQGVEVLKDGVSVGRMTTVGAPRFLFAEGRDVDFPKTQLQFDSGRNRLTTCLTSTVDSGDLDTILRNRWVCMWWDTFETDQVSTTTLLESTKVEKPTFYRHVKVLLEAGYVTKEKVGKVAWYSMIKDPRS